MYKVAICFLLIYGFALLCGAFAWIFVSSSSISVGLLARDCIVGLCAVSIPLAVVAAVMYICIRPASPPDTSVDIFIAMVTITAAAAGGIGAAIFHTPNAGSVIMASLFGGMMFSLCIFIIYSVGVVCLRQEEEEEEEEPDEVPEESTRYRVVEQPCGSTIQIAVLQN